MLEELKSLTAEELKERIEDLRKKIFNARMRITTDASVIKDYRKSRKDLARALTVLSQKAEVKE